MNRNDLKHFLLSFFSSLKDKAAFNAGIRPFYNLVFALKKELPVSIPLLREMAAIAIKQEMDLQKKDSFAGSLAWKIDRCYYRLCRVQQELGSLNFKKAAPNTSPEDFVFSQIDFSRYREIPEKTFEGLFLEGISDFSGGFFKSNFGLAAEEINPLIQASYKKTDGQYKIQKENPVILSVMRNLETSLENKSLFNAAQINMELKNLLDFVGAGMPDETGLLYPLLVSSLDNVHITHEDGTKTRLFVSGKEELSGTFQPEGKAWTRVLVNRDEQPPRPAHTVLN